MEKTLLVQGDVFLTRFSRIPKKAEKINFNYEKGYVLAEGEATGHAHRIMDKEAELFQCENILFLKTKKIIELKHEEHKPIKIGRGIWKVGIVKEYDPFLEEARNVKD
jgi:hypothetical protein